MPVKLDLGEFPQKQSIGKVYTTIGELEIFSINVGSQIALNKELGKPLIKCDPTDFIRHFIRYTCFPTNSVKNEESSLTKTRLSLEDVSKLTENELEAIAELYVKGNEHLFKKQNYKKKGDVGKEVFVIESGEIKYSKNDNENYIKYLLRLVINEEDEVKKSFEKAFEGLNSFSKGLSDQIKSTLAFGERIKGSNDINSLRSKDLFLPISPKIPEIHLTSQENLLNRISSILNKLFSVSTQSKDFLIEANKNQMDIAGEIKSSSDSATKLSIANIKLTSAVIIISILSLVLVNLKSCSDSRIQRDINHKNVNLIVGELLRINENIVDAKTDKYRLIKSRVNELEKNVIELKKIIERQNIELEKIRKQKGD